MPKEQEYECMVSFTYIATSPADAAQQFIANIANNPHWFVAVHEVKKNGKKFLVDTQTNETEKQ